MVEKTYFDGEIRKLQIISNNISFGPVPSPDQEVEQRLTINSQGRYWLSSYSYGDGNKYRLQYKVQSKISAEAVSKVFEQLAERCKTNPNFIDATDVGIWEMELTNTENEKFIYYGSMNIDEEFEKQFSDSLRSTLGIKDLFVLYEDR